jgi:uncharacterized repeat protein (TIGR03803 family)
LQWVFILCSTTAITLPAQTFTTLHSFDKTDGATPWAPPVQAADGNLYGTTAFGGAGSYGTVFKIAPSGALTTLYDFCSQSQCTDGASPYASLIQTANGDFYGTTQSGLADGYSGGYGTVFRITPNGALTTLYNFCSLFDCPDGANPFAGLVQTTNGDFYGTTYGGGVYDAGTIFKITPSGLLTTLYSFCSFDCPNGSNPNSVTAPIQATNGDFYGTTNPAEGDSYGAGTVYKMTPNGALTTLYAFCSQDGCADGEDPNGLIQAPNGDFYGTTSGGGTFNCASGCGTVFKITPNGALTTIYSFCSQIGCPDGQKPQAAPVRSASGDFYGTTTSGGANGQGTIFQITPSGALTTLYSFCPQSGCPDGYYPEAGLVQATNGDFYGTAAYGGANGAGTVFRLSLGLAPFAETQPTSGKAGAPVRILGTNLTGATSVTFNGTPAAFAVVRPSEITTTVPAGATTGTVQVVTPRGALSSNVPFRVR